MFSCLDVLTGWRLKPQLRGLQHKIFILDFFGVDKIHANLGVPPSQHLTAFLDVAEQPRTFLGYRVDPRYGSRTGAVGPLCRLLRFFFRWFGEEKRGRHTQGCLTRMPYKYALQVAAIAV